MFNYNLMKDMKIIEPNENGEKYIIRTIERLKELESERDIKSTIYLNNIERLILENKIVLGTPILKNILSKSEPVSSCTIVPIDLRKDLNNLKNILEPYAVTTMGSGYDLNQVENPCITIERISDVIHELIKTYSNRLSAMGTLDVSSPEILNYIDLKRNRDFNTCHYNISVRIPDDFFEGTKEYDVLENGNIRKVTNQEILKRMSEAIHCCGEPGIIFVDRFNETNPLPQKKYEYKSVAPCAEIAMSEGEVCQFSYINLSKLVDKDGKFDKDEFKLCICVITRMLDNLCDISIKNAKANPDIIEDKRRIGVGVCGFADMLAKLNVRYDSEESKKIARNIFTFINYYSKVESVKLSKERGPFKKYEDSLCSKEQWYDRFRKNENEWITDEQWKNLIKEIKQYGIRNSSTTAVPPTGRAAILVNTSYSIEPYFDLYDANIQNKLNQTFLDFISKKYSKEERKEIISKVLKTGNCAELNEKYNEVKDIFRTAKEIDAKEHIAVMANINNCVDESISKTVNLPNQITSEEIKDYIIYAYNKRLNGITFFRDRCLEERNIEEGKNK